MRSLRYLEKQGISSSIVYCYSDGTLDLSENTKVVVLTHASNVTGTILPIKEVAKLTMEIDIIFVVGCAQTAEGAPINITLEKYSYCILTFADHKSLLG